MAKQYRLHSDIAVVGDYEPWYNTTDAHDFLKQCSRFHISGNALPLCFNRYDWYQPGSCMSYTLKS